MGRERARDLVARDGRVLEHGVRRGPPAELPCHRQRRHRHVPGRRTNARRLGADRRSAAVRGQARGQKPDPHLMAVSPSLIPTPGTLLPMAERQRILSSSRLKLALTAFIVVLLAALCTFMHLLVTHIFHWLTPTIREDLGWKVSQGAAEVAEHAEVGMLLKDGPLIRDSFEHYTNDADVHAIVVTDGDGKVLALHGELPGALE